MQQMQTKTSDLNGLARSVGLKIHAGKSKVLKIGAKSDNQVTLDNTPLVEVSSFTYVGSIVDNQ